MEAVVILVVGYIEIKLVAQINQFVRRLSRRTAFTDVNLLVRNTNHVYMTRIYH